MWHRQSTTVRNVAGFRNTGQNTLFSNSFIRDSVISTLKQSGPEGERFSEYSSDANAEHNLTNPRLSTDRYRDSIRQSNGGPPTLYNKTLYPVRGDRRNSNVSKTSYFNEMIMTTESNNQKSKQSYYRERYNRQNPQLAQLPKGLNKANKKLRGKKFASNVALVETSNKQHNVNAGSVTVETDNGDLVVVEDNEYELQRQLQNKDVKIPSNLTRYSTLDRTHQASSVISRPTSPMIKISNQIESRQKKQRQSGNQDPSISNEAEQQEDNLNRTLYGMKNIEGKRESA